jgi:transcriptional regulator with XRE-family HTH domain
MNFYQKVVSLCEERGVSVSVAADEAGFARSSVTKWKQNPNIQPSLPIIEKLCSYFHVDRAYFLDEDTTGDFVVSNVSEEDKALIRLVLSASDEAKAAIRTLLCRE